MAGFESVINRLGDVVWNFGIPVGDASIPLVVLALIGAGGFLTIRLGLYN